MDELINLIFENPFLLFIIIAGLVSFFNRMKASSRDRNGREQPSAEREADTKPKQSPVREMMKRLEEMAESLDPDSPKQEQSAEAKTVEEKPKSTPRMSTFEQQREEQYKQLQKQYQSAQSEKPSEHIKNMDSPIFNDAQMMKGSIEANEISSTNINIKSRLNKSGLIESVVMAEVLGPPRARKQYSNRYLER
ncbi:MAG TPA: hypothetical protein VFF20_07975 [Pseudogracilibacillus sp.]|nr:hypothetical protein [Pseudogracilibacillus sp.]